MVIYIYALVLLLVIGIIWDSASGGVANMEIPRTITSVLVLICSYLSIALKHRVTARILKIEDLKINKLLWINKFLKTNKKKKLKPRFSTKTNLILTNILIWILFLVPLLGQAIPTDSAKYCYDQYFAITGLCLKNIVWIITLIASKFSIFWNKKRHLELI